MGEKHNKTWDYTEKKTHFKEILFLRALNNKR